MHKNKLLALKAKQQAELSKKQHQAAQGPYELSMIFNIDEVNEVVEQYKLENGLTDDDFTPEHVAYSVYHGDLILCLKNNLIPLEQEWFLGVDSHYYNKETDDVLTLPVQFQMPNMNFNDFKFGCKLAVDRGNGLKTRWRGINTELNEILLADVPLGFERFRSDTKLSCTTGFIDYECLREFNFVKKVIRAQGLSGIKKMNEEIAAHKQTSGVLVA